MIDKNKYFIVAIGRDPSLLDYCLPDLIITTNRVLFIGNTPAICLSDFLPKDNFLCLYDTDLTKIIDQQNKSFKYFVLSEIKKLAQGKKVLVSLYYNSYTNFLRDNDFELIGPSDELAYKFSSKTEAYQLALQEKVPVVSGKVNVSIEKLKEMLEKNKSGLFVAEDCDPYYPNNFYISNPDDLSKLNPNSRYLVTNWQNNIINSPNTQVIIGPKKIFYLGITDQIIRKGVKYYGNNYPCTSSKSHQDKIKEYSLIIARAMQQQGYRGIAGFDWIETKSGQIFMAEINPRKNRSSAMISGMLNHYRPSKAPSIFELEVMATRGDDWDIKEWAVPKNITWTMEVFRISENTTTKKNIKPAYSESNIFKEEKAYSILNFPPKDESVYSSCPDLARIITIGSHDTTLAKEQINKSLI